MDAKYYIKFGARDEANPYQEGLAHALEHMLFQGTSSRSWEDIIQGYRSSGAYYNAETDHDSTLYHIQSPLTHFDKAFEVLSDMVFDSVLPEERWEVEKSTILAEIAMYQDCPDTVLEERAYEDAFGKAYHSVPGSAGNIKKATVSELRYLKDSFYRGRNIFLSVSGNITEANLLKIVNQHNKWENRRVPKSVMQETASFNSDSLSINKEGMNQVCISFLKPIRYYKSLKDQIALDICLDLVYNYLYKELVFNKGYCYRVSATSFDAVPACSSIQLHTGCLPENADRLLEEIPKMVGTFLTEELTPSKIADSKLDYLRSLLEAETDQDTITRYMAEHYMQGFKSDPFVVMHSGILKLKDQTVRAVAASVLAGVTKVAIMR
jgi:predicted Zn-dependent peptidase